MEENIFLKEKSKLSLSDYLNFDGMGRGNLGEDIPILVYRLMEYAFREEIEESYGKEEQIRILRAAGFRSGEFFAKKLLDTSLELNEFISSLQNRMEELRIGVLRIEELDRESGKIILTVAEDADCSGLPMLGETVCNYDEGFISGVLSTYMKKRYTAVEIDCWATGDRVCRFHAEPEK